VAVAELVLLATGVLRALGVPAGEVDPEAPDCAPMAYRFSRGNAAMAAAITLVTTAIAATTARITTAIRLGPKGYAHLLHARLKPPDSY
jgi:hypothetical protein